MCRAANPSPYRIRPSAAARRLPFFTTSPPPPNIAIANRRTGNISTMTAPTKKRAARRPLPLPKKSHKSQERVVDSTDDEETTITTTETEAGTKTDTDSGSGSGSGSGSDSDSDSDTERDEPSTAPKSTPAYSYAPPPQFSLVPPSTSTRSNPFSAHNLAGKELWLISAPLAAPLSKLTVLNLADVAAGAPTLQTGSGKQYCLRTQDAESVEVAVHDGHGGYCIGRTYTYVHAPMVETD